jgi:hypothetical protein
MREFVCDNKREREGESGGQRRYNLSLSLVGSQYLTVPCHCPCRPHMGYMWWQARDEAGQAMTDEELWEDVHDIMGAGHETTATTTAAALHCISFHPEVERRVLSELDSVLGTSICFPMVF